MIPFDHCSGWNSFGSILLLRIGVIWKKVVLGGGSVAGRDGYKTPGGANKEGIGLSFLQH